MQAWAVLPSLSQPGRRRRREKGLYRPEVLTEPYSLPLLLMATKNRLATPKMLTTPRSTGDSSSRPGGAARVTPGQGTLAHPTCPGPGPPPANHRDPSF